MRPPKLPENPPQDSSTTPPKGRQGPLVIKKYANRRLYNTQTSTYVTLEMLCEMVRDGIDFAVYDAPTGDEITRSVLTQIIVEQEAKGENLLPISFLKKIIQFYGDSMGGFIPGYLDHVMLAVSENEDRIRSMMNEAAARMTASLGKNPLDALPKNPLGTPLGIGGMGTLQDMQRQNQQWVGQMMTLFNPLRWMEDEGKDVGVRDTAGKNARAKNSPEKPEAHTTADSNLEITNLKQDIAALKATLAKISKDAE